MSTWHIFCDFDGTIAERDMIVSIMEHFAPPEWRPICDDIFAERTTVRRGVTELFRLIPAARRQEIIDFAVDFARIRPGFTEMLQHCRDHGIRFWVTSGGVDFFIQPILAPFVQSGLLRPQQIYCNSADFSGERTEIIWTNSCDAQCPHGECGTCKTSLLRRVAAPGDRCAVIGDGITDWEVGKLADIVFARDKLLLRCQREGVRHVAFDTFFDIIPHLVGDPMFAGKEEAC